MSAERSDNFYTQYYARPFERLSARLQEDLRSQLNNTSDLWCFGVVLHNPKLASSFFALQNIRQENPDFFQGKDDQILAYSMYADNPNSIPTIARIFRQTESRITKWINQIIEQGDENDWTQYEEEIKRVEESRTSAVPIDVWTVKDHLLPALPNVFDEEEAAFVSHALLSPNLIELLRVTGLDRNTLKKRLNFAANILEVTGLIHPEYIRTEHSETLQLGYRMGCVRGFLIGNILFGRRNDVDRFADDKQNSLPIPSLDKKRRYKTKPQATIKDLLMLVPPEALPPHDAP